MDVLSKKNAETNQKLNILVARRKPKRSKKQLSESVCCEYAVVGEKALLVSAICNFAQSSPDRKVKACYAVFRQYLVSQFGKDILPVQAKKCLEELAPELEEKGIVLRRIGECIRIPDMKSMQRGFLICKL